MLQFLRLCLILKRATVCVPMYGEHCAINRLCATDWYVSLKLASNIQFSSLVYVFCTDIVTVCRQLHSKFSFHMLRQKGRDVHVWFEHFRPHSSVRMCWVATYCSSLSPLHAPWALALCFFSYSHRIVNEGIFCKHQAVGSEGGWVLQAVGQCRRLLA